MKFIRILFVGILFYGSACLGGETVTVKQLGFQPTEQPAGRCLVAGNAEFRRYGEGGFIKCKDDSLLMFFDRRRGTGDLDKSVMRVRRSRDGGQTWSEGRTVLEDPKESIIQPSLCRMEDGRIGMTFSRISLADTKQAIKQFVASADEGETWTQPVTISDGRCSYMTGTHDRLVKLDNGRMIALVHGKIKVSRPTHLVSYVFTSDNCGKTWINRTPEGLDAPENPFDKHAYGVWEASVVEVAPSRLLLYGRTSTGYIYQSRSQDGGTTWSEATQTDIPNPVAPMRLTKIPETDTLLMIRNPLVDMPSGWHGGARRALAAQVSTDGGETWSRCLQIEMIADQSQWFDYSYLLWDGDMLHLGYRAPARDSFGCSIYYQQFDKSRFLKLVESQD